MGTRTGRPERSPGPAGVRTAAKTLARTIVAHGRSIPDFICVDISH
ncbi:hypothetical protein ABIA39_005411 [Nocardia sp. GAS34]